MRPPLARIGALFAALWLALLMIWIGASVGVIAAPPLSPVYFSLVGHREYAPLALLLAALIFFMHRENIRRLLRGEEPRIGSKGAK